MNRRQFIWLFAGAFSALPGDAAVATQSTPPLAERDKRWERLKQWLQAALDHEPGALDAPALTVGSWSTAALESLFPYVKALAELLGTGEFKPGWAVFSGAEKELLKNLAGRTRGHDINRVMKRGALLHSDIAITVQMDSEPVLDRSPRQPASASRVGPRFSLPRRPTVLSDDARYQAVGREAIHWDFARMLLDSVRPTPSGDGVVRLWYQAIAAYFASRSLNAPALHHLERAWQLFPDDPDLLLDRGCLHETFAAPRVQTVIQTTTLPNGMRFEVASASSNLRDAERYFRLALNSNPDMTEARARPPAARPVRGRTQRAATGDPGNPRPAAPLLRTPFPGGCRTDARSLGCRARGVRKGCRALPEGAVTVPRAQPSGASPG